MTTITVTLHHDREPGGRLRFDVTSPPAVATAIELNARVRITQAIKREVQAIAAEALAAGFGDEVREAQGAAAVPLREEMLRKAGRTDQPTGGAN